MTFQDHFGRTAAAYATFRPDYPPALFTALAQLAPSRELAWDCATGSGQAARGLAGHFTRVIATDASAEQIGAAIPHEGVEYRIARAEASGLADAGVQLITVAQALHWLDLEAFWREARRVLAPRGVIAAWCYGLCEIDEAIDPLLRTFYAETVGPWWPPERRLVESGYRDIAFPFEEIAVPRQWMERAMTLPALLGYVGTWSAVQRHRDDVGRDPLVPLAEALRERWGPAGHARAVRWEIAMRVGRV